MFALLRSLKRRRLAKRPFPAHWYPYLERQVPFWQNLDEGRREVFCKQLKVFVWEKVFIAAGGMEITDEVKVVIAATAVRLSQGLDLSYYDRLTEIIVYPDAFIHPEQEDGVILGEAHDWGTVVLSWQAVLGGLQNPEDGHETGAHEFAHVLDRAGGAFDGTPQLRAYSHYGTWAEVMSKHFDGLRAGKRRQRKVLRSYGAQNEAEFFAVATEAFVEKPEQLAQQMPKLFDELVRFYGWDPRQEG